MTAEDIEALFTSQSGSFTFARWGRPIAPVVFGVNAETLSVIKGALEAVMVLSGHQMAETDPELGSNMMLFFFKDWDELTDVPDLDRLIPDLGPLVARLEREGANQYRIFRFDNAGAIQACFVFLRMEGQLSEIPAETLALGQIVQSVLLWSDRAFATKSPLAIANQRTILRPEIAGLIRVAYDPVLPAVSKDPSHALRLMARMGRGQ
ncbi:MAG: hypothetical protein WBC93_19775 [Sulfitobacter sp.]